MIQICDKMTKLILPIYAAYHSQIQLEMNEETQITSSCAREMETRQQPHHPSRLVGEDTLKSRHFQITLSPP